jgi:hypothetical protein
MYKKRSKQLKIIFIGLLLMSLFIIVPDANAQNGTGLTGNGTPGETTTTKPEAKPASTAPTKFTAKGLNPSETGQFMDNCIKDGNCSVCAVLATFAYGIDWMIKIGVLGAFVMVTYYGIRLLISAGESNKIKEARSGIIGTLIGIVILFSGWTIVNTVLSSVISGKLDTNVQLFGKDWGKFCNE